MEHVHREPTSGDGEPRVVRPQGGAPVHLRDGEVQSIEVNVDEPAPVTP